MRVVIALGLICLAFASSPSRAYDGSFVSVYQYQAWINAQVSARKRHYHRKRYHRRHYRARATGYSGGGSLGGIVSTLQAKCGAKVISGFRAGAVIPGGGQSCHATGQAVDMVGNYACMYSVLRSWPGGYTLDLGRCKHIHISSCRREWGMRFNHRSC
jgi:hypothetical protein